MKISVLGATGPSGQEVVKEALERGHRVAALVRNPDKLEEIKHDNLEVVKVDIYDSDSMVEPMQGSDAVISCLGVPPSFLSWYRITFYSDTVQPIVDAMRPAGVSRFICMSSWYTVYNPDDPFFINWLLKPLFLGQSLHNMGEMETYLEKQCPDIEFTSVRPPQLTNGPSSGKKLTCVEGQRVPGEKHITRRRDVAKFMLDCAESGEWKRKCVAISG